MRDVVLILEEEIHATRFVRDTPTTREDSPQMSSERGSGFVLEHVGIVVFAITESVNGAGQVLLAHQVEDGGCLRQAMVRETVRKNHNRANLIPLQTERLS